MPIYKMDGKKDGLQKYRVRINYTDQQGKSRQLGRVAYGSQAAKDLERQLMRDLSSIPSAKKTVQSLADEFEKAKKYEVRGSTLDENLKRIKTYIIPYLGSTQLSRLNAPVLQDWKNKIEEYRHKGEPLALSTKQSIYSTFRAMLNYAVKMDYLPKNPLTAVGNFKDAYEEKKEMDFYTPEEFLKFITAAENTAVTAELNGSFAEWSYYVFFNIAFFTGARKGEIYALKWSDIDAFKIMHIRRSISQKRTGGDTETPPKNRSSVRDIQLPEPLIKVLKDHYARCERIDGFTPDWRICGGPRCIRDSTLNKRNAAYSNAAGIKTIRIHDFRHAHASVLANEGINIQEIARRLGHSDIKMTWNTYSHLYPREEERAVSVLNNIKINSCKKRV